MEDTALGEPASDPLLDAKASIDVIMAQQVIYPFGIQIEGDSGCVSGKSTHCILIILRGKDNLI